MLLYKKIVAHDFRYEPRILHWDIDKKTNHILTENSNLHLLVPADKTYTMT